MEVVRHCYCEAKVRSSSVSVVYVLRLRIFSKGALQKRGSIEPIEPPLDPPLDSLQRVLSEPNSSLHEVSGGFISPKPP